jgi:hypothetical protein
MGARGINLAVEGHIVPALNPASISGGVTGLVFSLKNAAKANVIIAWGALAAAQGAVTLNACTSEAGANPTPIAFDRYQQLLAGAGNDVLAARSAVTAAGYVPSDVPNTIDVLHVQADQLPPGSPYLQLAIADGTNVDMASAVAVLTGVRYQGESNQTATV